MSQLTKEQAALASLMSDISETYYAAGWLIDLEYSLWDFVSGQHADFGTGTVTPKEIAELTAWACDIGGWIIYGDEGRQFIPMEDWLAMYRENRAAIIVSERQRFIESESFTIPELETIWKRLADIPPDSLRNLQSCMAEPPERIRMLREWIREALAAPSPEVRP